MICNIFGHDVGAWRSHLFSFPPSAASEVLLHLCQSCLVRWHGAPSSDTGAPRPYAATRHHGSHGGWGVSQRKQHRQRRKTMSIIISQFFGQQTNAIQHTSLSSYIHTKIVSTLSSFETFATVWSKWRNINIEPWTSFPSSFMIQDGNGCLPQIAKNP